MAAFPPSHLRKLRLFLPLIFAFLAPGAIIAAPPPQPSAQAPPQPAPIWQRQPDGAIVIHGTLEAAIDYPRVLVRLAKDNKTILGESNAFTDPANIQNLNDLDNELDGHATAHDDAFTAFLDTGASAYVISKSTAQRFAIQGVPNAVYHEAGLHGDTAMGVSRPYALSISGVGKPSAPQPPFLPVQPDASFQLSTVDSDALTQVITGEVNVIGMPAIRHFLVELDPGNTNADSAQLTNALANLNIDDINKPGVYEKLQDISLGPTVILHDPTRDKPGPTDITVPLVYTCFSRRHNPADKGPLPDLADNPTVPNVYTESHHHTFTGTWLLDTGAPATMISTKQAIALGLYDAKGDLACVPDYYLPLGGINGKTESVPGFRIAHLIIPAAGGKKLDYRGVSVFVSDVSTTLDNGQTVTLDGILGTNLWFPTVGGIETGFPTDGAPSAFQTVWIDGPGHQLLLRLQR